MEEINIMREGATINDTTYQRRIRNIMNCFVNVNLTDQASEPVASDIEKTVFKYFPWRLCILRGNQRQFEICMST